MRIRLLHFLLLLGGPILAQDTLKVELVLNAPARGMVQLAVCPDEASFKKSGRCTVRSVPANAPLVRVDLAGLEPGTYAIKAFHDVNSNGALDTNWLGVPNEPYGFSNDAMGSFGPPSFAEASFAVPKGTSKVRIKMMH